MTFTGLLISIAVHYFLKFILWVTNSGYTVVFIGSNLPWWVHISIFLTIFVLICMVILYGYYKEWRSKRLK